MPQHLINTEKDLIDSIEKLKKKTRLSLDTETTGLYPFHGDRLFSIIIGDTKDQYYFNFNYGGINKIHIKCLNELFQDNKIEWSFVNAIFDLCILHFEGLEIAGRIIDVPTLARIENNQHIGTSGTYWQEGSRLSMDYLNKYYLGRTKNDTVKEYIKKNDLYGICTVNKTKKPRYDLVPVEIIYPYGCDDVKDTAELRSVIATKINQKDLDYSAHRGELPTIVDSCKCEFETTKTLYKMKVRGFKQDRSYCERAYKDCLDLSNKLHREIESEIGEKFNLNSPKQVALFIKKLGLPLEKKLDKKGVWKGSYKTDALKLISYKHPVLEKVVLSKKPQKKANTYFKNFLKLMDEKDVIHCGLNQEVVKTFRLSSSEPNLQNLTTRGEGDASIPVKKAFISRNGVLLFKDFKQQEMLFMLDQARETSVINKLLKSEKPDFYLATAETIKEMSGIEMERAIAKEIALSLAYGKGDQALADKLDVSLLKAKDLKATFFKGLPRLRLLKEQLERQVKRYGYILNAYGRVLYLSRKDAYKAVNWYVQSSCAIMMKIALNNVENLCAGYKSNLILTVHDETILDVYPSELKEISPLIDKAMVSAYKANHISMMVDTEISRTSWHEKEAYEH